MIKSVCDVKKFWYICKPVTHCTPQYCVLLNRHECVISKYLVKSDIYLWAHLKMVTTVLSLCPPSKQDGSEEDGNESTLKLTSSFKKKKKKQRRVLSDSEEDVDASTRFVFYLNSCILCVKM